jgi:hypothetical protein
MTIPDHLPPTNAELENILARHGGIYTPKSPRDVEYFKLLNEQLSNIIPSIKKGFFKDQSRELRCEFLDSTGMNAFAYSGSTVDGEPFDFIGLNYGAMFTLIFTFRRIFSHPLNFLGIGSASLETAPQPIPYLTLDIINADFEVVNPRCPVRARAADVFSACAIDFLLCHELWHLMQGHTGYVRTLGHSSWTEALGSSPDLANLKTRQALEMDADFGAMLLAMNIARERRKAIVEGGQCDDLARAAYTVCFGTPESAILSLQFSTYLFFRLAAGGEWHWKAQEEVSHPLNQLRMIWSGLNIFLILEDSAFGLSRERFRDISWPNQLQAEWACARLVGEEDVDTAAMRSVVGNSIHKKYRVDLLNEWTRVRPELDTHKLVHQLRCPN